MKNYQRWARACVRFAGDPMQRARRCVPYGAAVFALSLIAGCSAEPGTAETGGPLTTGDTASASPVVPKAVPSLRSGALLRSHYMGKLDRSLSPELLNRSLRDAANRAATLEPDSKQALIMNVSVEGDMKAEVYDTDALAKEAEKSVVHEGDTVIAPGSSPLPDTDLNVEKSLSGGVDDRVYLGYPDYQGFNTTLSRIGTISGGLPDWHCSGSLVGARLVYTAGHCIAYNYVNGVSSLAIPLWFTPQQHGMAADYAPWGSPSVLGASYPVAFFTNNCHVQMTEPCVKFDFAVLELQTNPFPSGGPGYMAFQSASDATTISWYRQMVGFPGCTYASSPAQCAAKSPPQEWGDLQNCSGVTPTFYEGSTSNAWPWNDGTNPLMNSGCDNTEGQSGSPIFTYTGACSGGPCLFASISGNNGSPTFGAVGPRMNANIVNWVVSLRNQYP